MPSGSIDWQKVPEEDHYWNVQLVHEYPLRITGKKLWPNPHAMVFDESVCAIYQCPFGPEECFQVGLYGVQFHPQCLIENMIKNRQWSHCRSPFQPRLYLQFGLQDYMPNNWVLKPWDFPFELQKFDGQCVEWSWLYNCTKVELWNENKNGAWIRSAGQILYVADELYANKNPSMA